MEPKEALELLVNEARCRIGSESAERRRKLDAATATLAEKVVREEAAKPKRPTLEEIERHLRPVSTDSLSEAGRLDLAAADILKTLRGRGGELLRKWHLGVPHPREDYVNLLRDLGVQPKEA